MANYSPLSPINITKRTSPTRESRRRTLDLEKHGYTDDSSDDSEYSSDDSSHVSSRDTSGSYSSQRPLVRRKSSTNRPRPAPPYRPSRKIMRYMCCALISTLVIFMLSLIRMSIVSSRNVEKGDIGKRPPPPPEPWRQFEFLTRYYGGLRTLVPFTDNKPEYPTMDDEPALSNQTIVLTREIPASKPFPAYSNHTSKSYLSEHAPVHECFLDAESTIPVPDLRYYEGRPTGFPDNVMGSYEVIGLPEDICFERYGRLGPYGFGYSVKYGGTGTGEHGDKNGSESVWVNIKSAKEVDYRQVNWGDAQKRCREANAARFDPKAPVAEHPITFSLIPDVTQKRDAIVPSNSSAIAKKYLPRTAVVIRTWDEFEYSEENILHLRAMISELSLGSGGEYDVHLLVQIKNEAKYPVWADAETYEAHLNESVPEEFRSIATFWSETQMLMLYQGIFDTFARGPGLPAHGPYRGLQMAMQYFAQKHPEYDYFWHWEIDIRYTGHYYSLFSKIDSWTAKQPRKGLWERNSRFYIPSVHGSWEDFKQMVRVQTEMGTESPDTMWSGINRAKTNVPKPKGDKPIWGPERPQEPEDWYETENDPKPPTSYEKDKYIWGVGEAADLITFNPLFDPEGTTWLLAKDITGYNSSGLPPRRAAIVTSSRMSRKLLQTMHRETVFKKHHAFSEMWGPTTALHHGYKAVYVPHPMFVDRAWPTAYLSGVMNAGRNGASGGARTSVFGDREHNLLGMTWYYNAGFAPNLWKRWLGLKINGDGGEEFETTVDEGRDGKGVNGMRGGEGRMCLPPMLIHPVKYVELPVESVGTKGQEVEAEEGVVVGDPAA